MANADCARCLSVIASCIVNPPWDCKHVYGLVYITAVCVCVCVVHIHHNMCTSVGCVCIIAHGFNNNNCPALHSVSSHGLKQRSGSQSSELLWSSGQTVETDSGVEKTAVISLYSV